MRLKNYLYDYRIKNNLTQNQIADEIGISVVTYLYLEKNSKPNPSFKIVDKLAKYFNVTPQEIRDLI